MPNLLGLTRAEAAARLAQFGKNEIVLSKKISALNIFLAQFKSFLILILLLAAVLSIISALLQKNQDFLDAVFIFVILLLNAVLGFIQEYRAESAIAALKKLVPEKVRVIRDSRETEIDAAELVPGDIFILEEGKKIPADGKLAEAISLETNEASLTGESVSVSKEVAKEKLEDKNSVFAGTICERGFGKAEVTATGMNTRFGKIANLLQTIEEEPTPLQKSLSVLGRHLGFVGLLATVLVVIFGTVYGKKIFEMLLTGASLAVAIVPEGLPAIVTVTLAIGVQRMAKANSIVRKLSSIEAIGSVDVICSDKTGTITTNEMVVKRFFLNNSVYDLAKNSQLEKSDELNKILQVASLCSTASLTVEKGKTTVLGDRTEGSLLLFAKDLGFDFAKVRESGNLLDEFPFDPTVKMMSVIVSAGKKIEVLTKGAPEIVLGKSLKILINGKVLPLTSNEKSKIEAKISQESSTGYRLLAFAFKEIDSQLIGERNRVESDLVFVGFVSIFDPPRPEVGKAVEVIQRAGVRVVMITGDNPLTAVSIAKEVGLAQNGQNQVLTGSDLDKMTDDNLKEKLGEIKIFARVSPEHKLRIVQTFQNMGFSVAVTGDGVNDSPALKAADVGLAMGIIGTDVARQASDMVIADDNFASIVKAVEEGRVVFANILKSVKYLLSCNAAELLAILGVLMIGFPSPLTPVQILWMNLVTDGLPALALAQDPKDKNIMLQPPRSKSISILAGAGYLWILATGAILGLVTILAFIFLDVGASLVKARTVAFSFLVLGEMIVAFLVRPGERWYSNKFLLFAVIVTIILQVVIVFSPPFQLIFDTALPF